MQALVTFETYLHYNLVFEEFNKVKLVQSSTYIYMRLIFLSCF